MAYSTIAFFSFIFILIADIVSRVNTFIGVSNGSTELIALLNFVSVLGLLLLGMRYRWKGKLPYNGLLIFKLFMVWSIFTFFRGVFNASDYWDWKILFLSYSFTILVPLAIVLGLNFEISIKIFRFILNWLFIFGFIFVPLALLTDYELYPRIVAAVSLLLLFVPYLKFRWQVLVFIVAAASILMDLNYRANVMRILFSIFLLLIYCSKYFISQKIFNLLLGIFFCTPLLLLALGANGQFNVFTDNPFEIEVISGSDSNSGIANLSNDTRTFLYREVTSSMLKRDSSFIFGEGGGSAYETDWFAHLTLNERGRYGSEVGFLNALLYSGLIGVMLYALILFSAAYYAINRSNNYLSKMLGLFLAFHWIMYFVEDITKLDMNFFFIWMAIGMCLSNKFRYLTDIEIKRRFKFVDYQTRMIDNGRKVRHMGLRGSA